MQPDERPAHDDPPAAGPDRTRRARAVIDFRPYPTAPTRTRRSPAGPHRSSGRNGRPPTPSTVWFTPNPIPHEAAPDSSRTTASADPTSTARPSRASGAGESTSAWPLPVLTRAVTAFTESSATVLLLPWPAAPDASRMAAVPPDAVAAIVELDRRPRLGVPTASTADRADPDGTAGRVDLVITVMPARHNAAEHTDTVARIAARELRLGGILAVLTHCDRSSGALVDPTGPMVTAGQNADLLYLQHVVALHLPPLHLRDHAAGATQGRTPEPHRRVHSDVLVFAQPHDVASHPAAPPPQR